MFETLQQWPVKFAGIGIPKRRSPFPSVLANIRMAAEAVRNYKSEQLQLVAEELRQQWTKPAVDSHLMTRGFGLVCEALRRTLGVTLYDQQLQAATALMDNSVAEMQTGEGKTFACSPAVFLRSLTGKGVHVINPNTYLAERDCQLVAPVFATLGVTVGLLPENCPNSEKRRAYQCDVTYGTAYEFGFDYLRDQLALRKSHANALGENILSQLRGKIDDPRDTVQRGLTCAVVDEIDNVLLDDAISPLVLSESAPGEAPDAELYRVARHTIQRLQRRTHFEIDTVANCVRLNEDGQQRIHASDITIPVHQLRRTWSEYIERTLQAELLLHRDVHYVVDGDEIQIVEASTGRIFQDRTWSDGLHQAIEAKENLRITPETSTLAQVTRQRFFRLYQNLCGMTGTAKGCEAEFRHVYGLKLKSIPLRLPIQRATLPMRAFATAAAKFAAIVASVQTIQATGRPVLIGTKSISDSHCVGERLKAAGLAFQLLNGRQDADEASIIARAGQRGVVTLATNLAGRGTDIRLGTGVRELGGLHVVVAECNESSRIDRQLIGRCSRQGDPGSSQVFVSADDAVIRRYGEWLADYFKKNANKNGELELDISKQIGRIQHTSENAEYAARSALLRRDISLESLLSPRSLSE